MDDLGPRAREMADESMVRTLAAQACRSCDCRETFTRDRFVAHFNDMIATLEDPDGYGVWHVPVVAGRVP